MDVLQAFFSSLFTLGDPSTASVSFPIALEFGAVLAGAVSGALTACNMRMDLIGVCALAGASSLGGGLIRDMILSDQGVYMLDYPQAMLCCIVVAFLAFFFSSLIQRFEKPIAFFDIVSVALFCVMESILLPPAVSKVIVYWLIFHCAVIVIFSAGIVLGVLTAVGGGVIRDVIVGRVPAIFRASNFYAVCSLAGAVVYCLLVTHHMVKGWAALVSAAVVLSLRYLSLHYNWHTCAPIDLAQRYAQRHDASLDNAKDQEEKIKED